MEAAYVLGYLGVLLAKWAAGAGIGLSVYMARISFKAAVTGEHVEPDPMGLMLFISAGAIIAFVDALVNV